LNGWWYAVDLVQYISTLIINYLLGVETGCLKVSMLRAVSCYHLHNFMAIWYNYIQRLVDFVHVSAWFRLSSGRQSTKKNAVTASYNTDLQ
jgi:hypothetical protein